MSTLAAVGLARMRVAAAFAVAELVRRPTAARVVALQAAANASLESDHQKTPDGRFVRPIRLRSPFGNGTLAGAAAARDGRGPLRRNRAAAAFRARAARRRRAIGRLCVQRLETPLAFEPSR
jgi:hypothetical protein